MKGRWSVCTTARFYPWSAAVAAFPPLMMSRLCCSHTQRWGGRARDSSRRYCAFISTNMSTRCCHTWIWMIIKDLTCRGVLPDLFYFFLPLKLSVFFFPSRLPPPLHSFMFHRVPWVTALRQYLQRGWGSGSTLSTVKLNYTQNLTHLSWFHYVKDPNHEAGKLDK